MGSKPIPGDTSGTERPTDLISRKRGIEKGPRLTGMTDSNGSYTAHQSATPVKNGPLKGHLVARRR
jgi:hypothetical protein